MATQNSVDNASDQFSSQSITIDPGASGDSYTQFDINTTGEFRIGVDDGSSDSFKISQGSALGTNDTFVITTSGNITMPLQPAFLATLNSEQNITGDSTVHSTGEKIATTEIFDKGSDFFPGPVTPATFTAPVTGKYYLTFTLSNRIKPGGGDEFLMTIATSNRSYTGFVLPTEHRVTNFVGFADRLVYSFGIIADMDASDTATWEYKVSGGTKVDDSQEGSLSGSLLV